MVVPWPGALMMASVPSTMRARSIAERRPKCRPASPRLSACSGENPIPSSLIVPSS
ncbi:MAG TPA: hypothetical protein VNS99_02060 [Gaiellales bacterium]|nr:hypothetical protein [Gaiellales bacterium]